MALTLVEAAKTALNEGKTLRATVIAMFARASDILMALPFKDIEGNAYQYNREGVLPGVAFRGVNGSYTASTGVVNPLIEALRICGGDLAVDQFIIATQGEQARANQESMKIKALAAELTRVIIKGDSTTAASYEFDGFQNRATGAQLIENGSTDGGDVLSLAKLDAAIDQTSSPTHIIMSKAMRRLLTTASRGASFNGLLGESVDNFGRQIKTYAGLPILVPYSDNGGTEPIAFDELGSTGATATASSIYVVSFGDGMVSGIQNKLGMQVRDIGELETAPQVLTRVEWYAGLCVEHGRALTRLRGIKTGAVVA
jgi:hypothetical protein